MDLREEIAKVAYELYERDGRSGGKELDHWLEAERIVRERHSSKGKTPAAPAAKPKKAPAKKPGKK